MKGEQRSVGSVYLLPDNPRHGDIGAISESLRRFGQQKPIVVNQEGIILAGNHTYQAAVALGWEQIWVVESGLEGSDQTGFALADNRLSDLATYDHDILLQQLQELDGLEGTGYDLEDMEELRVEVEGPEFSGDDRFTPAWVFEGMAVEFDVDLAAPSGGISYIPAAKWFTEKEDGLAQDWTGLSAWCNPPYSAATKWAVKFASEIVEGCFLGPLSSGTSWQMELLEKCRLIWVPDRGELSFMQPSGVDETIRWPVWMFGVGDLGETALRNLQVAEPHRGRLLAVVR